MGRATCWSCTTRCSSSRCTASRRRRRRAAPSARSPDAGCALLTAHTNADQAVGGVSEALAHGARPDRPGADRRRPATGAARQAHRLRPGRRRRRRVRAALAEAGAGRIGDYDHASFSTPGEGRFRPLEGANPDDRRGRRGSRSSTRCGSRCVLPRARRGRRSSRRCWRRTPTRSRRTTSSSSPTPARPATGTGRIGTVARTTLGEFARHGGRRAARDRARRAGGRRPGPAGAPGRGVRRRGRLPARRGARAPTPTST